MAEGGNTTLESDKTEIVVLVGPPGRLLLLQLLLREMSTVT